MATSTDDAFAIPELLEHVLLHLPGKDLLCTQRVARRWPQMTKSSIHIQQELFYKTETTAAASKAQVPEINPLARDILGRGSCETQGSTS